MTPATNGLKREALRELADTVLASGLLKGCDSAVVMISGGPDSACAAAGMVGALGAESVHALHVNYRMREGAAEGEAAARRLCAALRIDLHIERPQEPLEGNVQAAARALRYGAAEKLRRRTGSDLVVTGHTRTDVVETVLYRLATSPGTRALLGLAPRSGRIIRPLLKLERERVRELAEGAGLPFADDETNAMPVFARNRIRSEVLPLMRELSPAAIRNVAETRAELAEEAALLERVVLEALDAVGAGAGALSVDADALMRFEPALQRLALRALAERAAGRPVALGRARAAEIVRLAERPEGGEIELGGGLVAVCEAGYVCFRTATADAAPEPVLLNVPGRVRLGEWEVRAELRPGPLEPAGPDLATLDAAAISGRPIEVRTWKPGDRIRPLGMGGTKTLQDLFTDCRVPRSRRHRIPVVTVGGAIAWVAGVAVSEDFRLVRSTDQVAVLTAHKVA
ncbi:MAG TPA: tRNA lysidine(34) synthetase TilS [Solirubrobacterales bacterium]|nr:tRNA lysidine(34) synthetase TilS [Solirubrobacterales bacterium]